MDQISLVSPTEKIIAVPKVVTNPIIEELKTISSEDRCVRKCEEIERLAKDGNWDFEGDGYTVRFLTMPRKRVDNGLLEFNLEVRKDGKLVDISNPFLIKNPPLLVSDGTKYKDVITVFDQETEIELDNFEYNPKKAIQMSILHTLKALNK